MSDSATDSTPPDKAPPRPKRPRAAALMAMLGYVDTPSIDREQGRVDMLFQPRREHCHSGGIVQGGIITGWLDAAMASAVFVSRGSGTSMASLEIKTVYYDAVRIDGGAYRVQAWVDRMGRRTAFLEARLLDANGNTLAKATSTVTVRSPPQSS